MELNAVNPHCLENISRLSETREVIAAEDIVDHQGTKLWAKGNQVDHALTEKLLKRKLAKPLETSLTVENALTMADIVNACHTHLEENSLLGCIAGRDALSLLEEHKNIHLPEPMRLLLTTAKESELVTFKHTLGTLLVSAGVATLLKASDHDAKILLLATLLHDLGEIYINPAFLKKSHRLAPHEWKHLACHPKIGQVLVKELTELPSSVGQCIAHHHERLDGSGYPSQINRQAHHPLANWLAIADTLTPILTDGGDAAPLRAMLALRVTPAEFDHGVVSAVSQALKKAENIMPANGGSPATKTKAAQATWQRLDDAIVQAKALCEPTSHAFVRATASNALILLSSLKQSLRATGVSEFGSLDENDENDIELVVEICQVEVELIWRMRNLARNMHMRAEQHLDANCLAVLKPLISTLDVEQRE